MAGSTFNTSGKRVEFVEAVPNSLTCPVCLEPLWEPHLLDCCGGSYCSSCIDHIMATSQPSCPLCRDEQFNRIPNKAIQRQMLKLKVRCSRKKDGCEWEGELRYLSDHEREEHGEESLYINYTREMSLIQDFIQRQGKVRIRPLRMLLYGPPCTGKTATTLRLSNQIEYLDRTEPQLPSTGFEKPVTVEVELYPRAQKTSVRITHAAMWRHQNLKQQCQVLCSSSLHHASSSKHSTPPDMPNLLVTPSGDADKTDGVDKHLSDLIEAQEWRLVRDELAVEDHTVIHIVDCGGHPEFHEILPLLLEGEALSLLFLNLAYEFDHVFQVVYRGKEGPSNITYQSEFTTGDILRRVLTSISMVQFGHQKIPPALLVGTYLDETDDEHVDMLESAVQENLKSFIEKDILCPSSVTAEGKKYITALDNMGEHPGDIDTLRKVILDTVEKRFQYKDIPTSWLLLDIFLRSKYEKNPGWCTLDECIAIARDCGITKEELLGDEKKGRPGILHIIHRHYGTLLYFSKVPGLCLKVLCNPNVILHPITKLLIVRFACNPAMIETARKIQDTGEVPHYLMEEVCAGNSSDSIPIEEIIDLLISRFILYKISHSSDGTTTYFIPCLLKPDVNLTKDVADLFPSPIILVPLTTGIVPPGVCSAMVVNLSSNLHEEWILDEEVRFRNRVRFDVHFEGSIMKVEILQHLRFLELRFLTKLSASSVLVKCRKDFWNALASVSDTSKLNWCWGFYCPGSGQSPHPAIYRVPIPALKSAPRQVQCFNKPRCQRNGIFNLKEMHTIWFQDLPSHASAESVKCTEFTLEHLCWLMRKLDDLAPKWKDFGIQLDVPYCECSKIEVDYRKCSDCLRETVVWWLTNSTRPNSLDLINALNNIGEKRLAHSIQQDLCQGLIPIGHSEDISVGLSKKAKQLAVAFSNSGSLYQGGAEDISVGLSKKAKQLAVAFSNSGSLYRGGVETRKDAATDRILTDFCSNSEHVHIRQPLLKKDETNNRKCCCCCL